MGDRPPTVSAKAATVRAAQYNPRPYRHKIRNLAYVDLNADRGILRDLSEFGMAVQSLASLQAEQQVRLRVDLPDPRLRVEAQGRVAWTDAGGQAGVEFLDLPRRSRRQLQEWILTQLLAGAYNALADETAALLFSSTARPVIRLKPESIHPPKRLRLAGISVSARAFSRAVDGLVLLCAVLLFHVLALVLTDTLPSWPVASALALGATSVFVLLYWGLFGVFFRATPGNRLAELACRESISRKRRQEARARFR